MLLCVDRVKLAQEVLLVLKERRVVTVKLD